MFGKSVTCAVGAMVLASLGGCGGSGTGSTPVTPQSGTVPLLVSDAPSENWAMIGVKVLSVTLTPQGGGNAVAVYTAPRNGAPLLNLAQLDSLGEIFGDASMPTGTYTGATVTVSADDGDVVLTTSANPDPTFPVAASTTIPSNRIKVQNAKGSAPNRTVDVDVSFAKAVTIAKGQNEALDLEFNLDHPAFLVAHTLNGATVWAVNFDGPVRRLPIPDLTRVVLRHTYGNVSAVASDNSSITIDKQLPAYPVANRETAVTTGVSLDIQADATNGTLFYDVDARTSTSLTSFASVASTLKGKYVRVAARYQSDGTLVAVRIWASSDFNSVWLSPEGHVLHVDAAHSWFSVADESGAPVQLNVDANTQFFFRTPQDAQADATSIGSGVQFLASHDLARGFKVHASVVDPLATTLVAQTVDIEAAVYQGQISGATGNSFTQTRGFATTSDNYTVTLPYLSSSSPNGKDADGNAIKGFKWWNFTFPTQVDSGSNAIGDFVSATSGSVDFHGSVPGLVGGLVPVWGVSAAKWNDPAKPNGWSAAWTVLVPTPLPLGEVTSGIAGTQFVMGVTGGGTLATVDLDETSGSATRVYQVDRSNGIVTVTPLDISTSSGQNTLVANLFPGTLVKVYGIPQADLTLKAYVVLYFTGDQPAS